jgi:DNA-binding NarL/FixJ family response regulator
MYMRLRPRAPKPILPHPPMPMTANSIPSPPPVLRVAVVEDDRSTRDGLRLLIDGTPGFRCVGTFPTAEAALHATITTDRQADVVLLDVHLPGMTGTDAVPRLRERWPDTLILMLTVFAEDETVFTSLCRGASGYLLKKTPPARLLDAIREASDGGAPMSPEIARKVIRMFRDFQPRERGGVGVDVGLTANELRLLQLLADGYSYRAAGEHLRVSINTIRSYIRSIYDKLHVHSKSEAVSKALKAGLI